MRRFSTPLSAILAACTLGLSSTACQAPSDNVVWVTSTTTITSGPGPSAGETPGTAGDTSKTNAGGVTERLQALVDTAVQVHGGSAAVAIAHPGGGIDVAGTDRALPAWSTIKVPISIASLRSNQAVLPQVTSAITASDNAAAEQLWASLGTPEQAAASTGTILREAGVEVSVNAVKVRPEFSTFGQTQMTTQQLAAFAAGLPRLKDANTVLDLMGQIDASQSYGLGQISGARFKGGWGPNPAGLYDVRQIGVINTTGGNAGVALTLSPAGGSYEEAQAMANIIAEGLSEILQ